MDVLEEELLALDAIYPECISRDSHIPRRLVIHPLSDSGSNVVSITLLMPDEYPEKPPVVLGHSGLDSSVIQESLGSSWTAGEVCLYVFLDKLRELPHGTNANEAQGSPPPRDIGNVMSDDMSSVDGENRGYVFAISDPIVDRKSTFVGRAIEVHSRAEAKAALLWLKQNDKKIAKATHNIVAWRVIEDGISMQDNDDDGEDAGGGRLAHLLEILDITNVMVVVSRWYGGIKLHGDRFKHISNVGREALQVGGFLPGQGGKAGQRKKPKRRN